MLDSKLFRVICLPPMLAWSSLAFPYASGISGYDGYSDTCASAGCHTGTPYAAGAATLTGLTSRAIGTGGVYTIRSSNSNAVESGFNAVVRNGAGTTAGSFSSLGASVAAGTNNDVRHSAPATPQFTYSFTWTAPTTPGAFTMWGCVNQVNGDNGASAADGPPQCGTRSITVTNTPPNANPDTASVFEDGPAIVDVIGDDDDGDAAVFQALSVTSVAQPTVAPNGTTSGGVPSGMVTYNPNGQFEFLAAGESTTDIFTYVLSDGYNTDTGTVTVTINGANDAPTVSVDGNPGFQEGDGPVTLDSTITVFDPDTSNTINRARVVITNPAVGGQDVLACAGTLGVGKLIGITSCIYSGSTLTLSGTTSQPNYADALETVTYQNTSPNPTTGDRTITFDVRDSSNVNSATDSVIVSVSSVNTPPTITAFSPATNFTENAPQALGGTVTLFDPDSTLMNRAQLTLTTIYPNDELRCPSAGILTTNNISSCSYVAPTLTLSSAGATVGQLSTAIKAVEFNNTSDDPAPNNRIIQLTVRDSTNVSSTGVSKNITVTPLNDPPSFTTVPNLSATENVVNSVSHQVVETDPDDSGAGLTYSFVSGAPTGMAISSSGLITWTPPRAGTNTAYTGIQVRVADGGENGAAAATQTFTVTVSPPDADADGVPNYSDNCPLVSNAGQADLDNDTVRILPQTDPSNIPANGDVNPAATDAKGFRTGGDVCDEDEDGDGIPNSIEGNPGFPFLNPRDPADAAMDQDGDGLSNLQEYENDNTGASMTVDSVGPVVIAPASLTVNSTGYLTRVNLGVASATDGNDGNITSIVPIVDATITLCSELTNYPLTAPAFRPGAHTVTWTTCDKVGNLATAAQTVNVRPILSISPGQFVGEGQTAIVKFTLNGPPPSYPVNVDYLVGGTANSADHDLASSTLTIASGLSGQLSINITADALSEDDESILISLSNISNAVLSQVNTHETTIVNYDTAPILSTAVTQNSMATGRTVYADAGSVELMVNTSDTNLTTTPSFDWSLTDNAINGIGTISDTASSSRLSFSPLGLAAGMYPVSVVVSDNGRITTSRYLLKVVATTPALAAVDTDGDGLNDNNGSEGAVDSKANGIPNYLDDNRIVAGNVLQNQTGDPANSYLLATDAGLRLRLGNTALAAGAGGVMISQQDIDDHGGADGGIGLATTDSYNNLGGFYDFEVTGLNEFVSSARIVIPLQAAILNNAQYRKYNGGFWSAFVVDANNTVSSARGELGVCPAPGSSAYTPGLTAFDFCVQLTIEDGGPNDTDRVRDYVVRDPGGVAVAPVAVVVPETPRGRIGVLHPAVLLVFVLFSLLSWRKVRR